MPSKSGWRISILFQPSTDTMGTMPPPFAGGDAAVAAGAPTDLMLCMTAPTLEGTQELLRHKRTAVVLATGGYPMVRAAYSSGKPAYGVGPGNVPAIVERTADVLFGARCALELDALWAGDLLEKWQHCASVTCWVQMAQ